MCERKAKKDAPAAVVSHMACLSRAPPADASRPALSGWVRPPSLLSASTLACCLAANLRVGLTRISSQLPVSDLGE